MEQEKTITTEIRAEVKGMVDEVLAKSTEQISQVVEISKNLAELSKKYEVNEDKKKELEHTDPNFAFSKYVVAMRKKDYATMESMVKAADPNNRTTNADGAYTIPTIVQSEILRLIPTYSQALQYCRVIPLANGNTVNFPSKLTGFTTSVVGEESSITSSKPTFGQVSLAASKFASLGVVTNELLQDSNSAIGAYLLEQMMESMGTKVDSLIFQDGNTTWSGIFYGSNTFGNTELTSTTNGESLTYQNIVNAAYGVDQNYLNGASWFMSRTVLAKVRGLLDLQNRPIFEPASAGAPATILGYPVVVIENAPALPSAAGKTIMLLGNLNNSILGDVAGYSITYDSSATVDDTSMYQYDLSAIRMIKRWSFDKGLVSGYSTIETAAS